MSSVQAAPSYSPHLFAAALTPKGTARLQPNPKQNPLNEPQGVASPTPLEPANGDSQAALGMTLLRAAGAIAVASKATTPSQITYFA